MTHYKQEVRLIKDLIPYVNNSRTHSDDQVNQIASSIKKFGFTSPILIDEQGGVTPVAPLTPELTASISPSYEFTLGNGANITTRLDYSYRGEMYGEPSSDPGRLTQIDSRELVNVDISYAPADADWSVALYGHNVFDKRYDNARINTGDYILRIMSNDASEFGLRYSVKF